MKEFSRVEFSSTLILGIVSELTRLLVEVKGLEELLESAARLWARCPEFPAVWFHLPETGVTYFEGPTGSGPTLNADVLSAPHCCRVGNLSQLSRPLAMSSESVVAGVFIDPEGAKTEVRQAFEALTANLEALSAILPNLRQNHHLLAYSEVIEATDDALLTTDLEGRIRHANQGGVKMFGLPIEELVGTSIADLCPPELGQRQAQVLNHVRELGTCQTDRTERLRKDGSRFPVELTACPEFSDDGSFQGFRAVLRDLSARLRVESLVEQLHEVLVAEDTENLFPELVRRLAELLEVRNAAVMRKVGDDWARILAMWPAASSDSILYELAHTPCAEVISRNEVCFYPRGVPELFPDAPLVKKLDVESYLGAPLRSPEGEVIGLLVVWDGKPLEDRPFRRRVLEMVGLRAGCELLRREGQCELKSLADRLAQAVDAGQLGVWDWDIANDRLHWDARMFQIYGIPPEEFQGSYEDWMSRLHSEDREQAERALRALLEDGVPFQTPFRVVRPDGETRIVQPNAVIHRDEDGNPFRVVGMNVDITDRERARLERDALLEERHHSQRMESVGRLAGGVAHDFNNLLNVILTSSELARAQLGPEHIAYNDLREIEISAQRGARLTRRLLAFARKQTIVPQVLMLNEVVSKSLAMIRRLIGADITVRWHPGEELWNLKADPSQIDQILINVCLNAREAIEGCGTVEIATSNVVLTNETCRQYTDGYAGEFVKLVVTDDGCGMDRETLSKAFDPFFTTKADGSGFGLSTVYGIVRQNEGLIEVTSRPGEGTSTRLLWPRHQGELRAPSLQGTNGSGGGQSILLVEDEPAVLRVIQRLLESMGYKVTSTQSSTRALELFSEEDFDLLITDLVMPEMNGDELIMKLRERTPGLRVVMMSGYSSNSVLPEGEHFLQKPFTREALAERVNSALESLPG